MYQFIFIALLRPVACIRKNILAFVRVFVYEGNKEQTTKEREKKMGGHGIDRYCCHIVVSKVNKTEAIPLKTCKTHNIEPLTIEYLAQPCTQTRHRMPTDTLTFGNPNNLVCVFKSILITINEGYLKTVRMWPV